MRKKTTQCVCNDKKCANEASNETAPDEMKSVFREGESKVRVIMGGMVSLTVLREKLFLRLVPVVIMVLSKLAQVLALSSVLRIYLWKNLRDT